MATSKAQRAGIWVIAGALTIGTMAGFVAMIIAPQNEAADQKKAEKEYQQMMEEAQKAQRAQNEPLKGYEAQEFDKDTVKELKVTYRKKGTGTKVKSTDTISASYFGWDSSGTIFDSTKKKETKTSTPVEFGLQNVIEGWTKGLTGVPVGSTVELTIPGDMAYGNTDNGDGRPFGPLKFIVTIEKIVEK
jgi:peptidylprolyl isomerase